MDEIDSLKNVDIEQVLNWYAEGGWIVKHVYNWDMYLLVDKYMKDFIKKHPDISPDFNDEIENYKLLMGIQ